MGISQLIIVTDMIQLLGNEHTIKSLKLLKLNKKEDGFAWFSIRKQNSTYKSTDHRSRFIQLLEKIKIKSLKLLKSYEEVFVSRNCLLISKRNLTYRNNISPLIIVTDSYLIFFFSKKNKKLIL